MEESDKHLIVSTAIVNSSTVESDFGNFFFSSADIFETITARQLV